MQLPLTVEPFTRNLTAPPRESEHFRIFYGRWSPFESPALSRNGLRDETVLGVYLEAFEDAYALMRTRFAWAPPRTDDSGRIQAYVLYMSGPFPGSDEPLTWQDADHVPFILLPSRSGEATQAGILQRAAADAAHETAHAFLDCAQPGRPCPWGQRIWFDECVASYVERIALRDNPQWLVGCRRWCDHPETPLDDPTVEYNGLFAAYLVRRFGDDVLAKLWRRAAPRRNPLSVLNEVMSDEQPALASPDPSTCRLVAEYCADSYFLNDPASHAYAPDVYARFGARIPAATLTLGVGQVRRTEELRVTRLACQYATLKLRDGVRRLVLELHPSTAPPTPLRAHASVVAGDGTRMAQREFHPRSGDVSNALGTELAELDTRQIHHVVVTIANCRVRGHDVQSCYLKVSAS